jgi:glycosyltransferase involved in cell wall biosynthesis
MTDTISTGKRPQVHAVYEYSSDFRPHSSPFLRLIRPLSHLQVQAHIDSFFNVDYNGEPVDLVIVDRLWRRDVSLQLVQELVNRIHSKRAKLVYSLDDNYFDLDFKNISWPTEEILPIVAFLLQQADAVWVTTSVLRERLLEYNPVIHILPNQLDERLLVIRHPPDLPPLINKNRIVIGYMGTFTHDEDFMMILPALKAIHKHYPGRIELQICGVFRNKDSKTELQELPIRYINPLPEEHEYPLFMLWFTGHVRWDIAISPLRESSFNNCKSDIKFLDYAAMGAAGIFSQSPAYISTVHHKENGWITENTPEAWEEALETLINDINLRLKISQNALHYLYSDRILMQQASRWVDMIETLCS